MADARAVMWDLEAESREVEALVTSLGDADWALPTPAPGWTITHQIAHLEWTDRVVLLAARQPERFAETVSALVNAEPGRSPVDEGAADGAARPRAELLADWRRHREELATLLAAMPRGRRLPWFGPPMSAASMASARLMETWAHGQDIADALGLRRTPTARLWHVARLGVRTRDFAFATHGLTPPSEEFRVDLAAPGGGRWVFGPEDAAQHVTGDAHDFCLLVTQRVHPMDTDLRAEGEQAATWLTLAQAFAGPPGAGRPRTVERS